nr:LysR family transcriptional regulator [Candidatus Sigynarchaeota archaeon]
MKNLRVRYRVWIEISDNHPVDTTQKKTSRKKETSGFIVGLGVARLLKAIKTTGSLTGAANELGYSYKYAWDRTKKLKERLGEQAVEAKKGGKGGGGEMTLSEAGENILRMYNEWDEFIRACCERKDQIEASGILKN